LVRLCRKLANKGNKAFGWKQNNPGQKTIGKNKKKTRNRAQRDAAAGQREGSGRIAREQRQAKRRLFLFFFFFHRFLVWRWFFLIFPTPSI